jgi:alpha-L-rhamnosidase
MKHRAVMLTFAAAVLAAGLGGAAEPVAVGRLRCEWAVNPLGIDARQPRLSWVLESTRRGTMQSAYQVLVASSEALLRADRGDLWDSGRVESDQSIQIAYGGPALASGRRVYWKVRVWDEHRQPSAYSEAAWWELGLLEPQDWKAKWIAFPHPAAPYPAALSLTDVPWIGYPQEGSSPPARDEVLLLRRALELPAEAKMRSATLLIAAAGGFYLRVNGVWVGAGRAMTLVDLRDDLLPGRNEIGLACPGGPGNGSIAARLVVEFETGAPLVLSTDSAWEAGRQSAAEHRAGAFPSAAWVGAREQGRFEEGLRGGRWFRQDRLLAKPPMGPAPYLRKSFSITKPLRAARLYATALGVYELRLNGRRVGEDVLAPGWTDYTKRVQYQTYDVTPLLQTGANALGVILGDGWYAGHIGWEGARAYYGTVPMARVLLRLEYADGSSETVGSDASWKGATGPILYSDFLKGEMYDARRERDGWDRSGFPESGWTSVTEPSAPDIQIAAQQGPPVQKTQELRARSVSEPEPGRFVFDLGQNMVGWARLKVRGPAGTRVDLRFSEMLNPDGTLYTINLRAARSADGYVLKGTKAGEVFEPRFTFHGFRYVEVRGYPGRPSLDAVTGVVVHSVIPATGSLETSSELVNQLHRNIDWGQRGNFLSVPTDCPQRDERLGWTGDAQIFARTACLNRDVAGFFTKWMIDLEDAQSAEGGFPNVAPRLLSLEDGAPAWADAGVIVPWTMYECYGDVALLARHYQAMVRWLRYVDAANPDHLWRFRVNNNYGDWVSVNSNTPRDVVSTSFFAHSARLLSQAAQVLGKTEDARRYEELFQAIRAAFNEEFVTPSGRITGNTQTGYALALRFDLLPEDKRALAARYLVEDIERNGGLTTGFVGVRHLLPALSEAGRDDVAYRLLLSETFPSWGYSIKHGATTIWERWDGWTQEKGFQDTGMNSFNHYSFGSVGEWMYRFLAGIDADPDGPGHKRLLIRPRPGGGLSFARASYESVYGRVATEWRLEGGGLALKVMVPPNTTATVYVPGAASSSVTEGGIAVDRAPGVRLLRREGTSSVYGVGAGAYDFRVAEFRP